MLVALLLGPPCTAAVTLGGALSAPALVAVGVTGTALVAVGLALRSGAGAPPVGRRGLAWLLWALSVLGWELVALAADALPTLSDLADPVLAHPVARAAATTGWLAGGAWLVTRPGAGPPR